MRPRISAGRVPRRKPEGLPPTYVCPACDYILWDGVDYLDCPACGLEVDWVDTRNPLWCCARCDAFVNEPRAEWPRCTRCDLLMDRIGLADAPIANPSPTPLGDALLVGGQVAYLACLAAQLVVYAMDPLGFAFVAPIALIIVVGAVVLVGMVALSIRGLVALVAARTTRVVHGLEHATIAVLQERGHVALDGETLVGEFFVDVVNDGKASAAAIRDATETAIRRVLGGERRLAYTPQCGTSIIVALLLASLVIIGGATAGIVRGLPANVVATLVAAACAVTWLFAKPLGLLAQRVLTVSTRFASVRVGHVGHEVTPDGHRARFLVRVAVDGATPAS